MKTFPLLLNEPPPLSDEAATQLLDFLHELINGFENYYAPQLLRAAQEQALDRSQPDLFAEDHQGLDDDVSS
jgi:hypothetical protein